MGKCTGIAAFDVRLGLHSPEAPASPLACAPLRPLSWERSRRATRTLDIDFQRAGGRGSHFVSSIRQLSRSPFRFSQAAGPPSASFPGRREWGGGTGERRGGGHAARVFSQGAAAWSRPNICTHINTVLVQMTFRSLCLPRPPFSFHHQQIKISWEDYRKRFQAGADLYSRRFVMILMMMMVKRTV